MAEYPTAYARSAYDNDIAVPMNEDMRGPIRTALSTAERLASELDEAIGLLVTKVSPVTSPSRPAPDPGDTATAVHPDDLSPVLVDLSSLIQHLQSMTTRVRKVSERVQL